MASKHVLFSIPAAVVLLGFCVTSSAQSIVYDPLLDPSATVITAPEVRTMNASWMWHPGQLASYLQAKNLKHSKERCVNVGYPGNYYSPIDHATFQQEAKLSSDVTLNWKASGNAVLYIDGQVAASGDAGATPVKKGKHIVTVEVRTSDRTPALIAEGLPQGAWTASTGEKFIPVESDDIFNSPDVYPDDDREITVSIPVKDYLTIRNAKEDNGVVTMTEGGLLVVDFTYLELAGLSLAAEGDGEISIYFGESFEEAAALRQVDHEQALIAPYKLSRQEQTISTPARGFRYAALRTTGKCTVRNIQMLAKVWPVKLQMQFNCSDDDLNRLFAAGVGTQHSSIHNFYLDGVKRDFLPWAMDAVASSMGGDYAFGERQLSRNGISIALLPPGATEEDLGVVDYPLHALIGLWEEYLRFNDKQTGLMFRDRIEGQLALYETLQDERGFISSKDPRWGFIPGWDRDNGPENIGTPAYPQMLLYRNFCIAADFEKLWGDRKAAAHYTQKAEALKASIMKHFWDPSQRAFVNGYTIDGKLDKRLSHHSQSWAVYSNLFPEEDIDNLFEKVYPSMEYYLNDVSYEKGYEAISYIKCGKTKEFVDVLKKVWLRWLDAGNTRFPENFMINESYQKQLEFYGRPFGLSLCHGANGIPPIVTALYGILGFNQKSVSEYILNPDLIGMSYASGRIPVSQGHIEVEYHAGNEAKVTVPAGCAVTVNFEGRTARYTKAGTYYL